MFELFEKKPRKDMKTVSVNTLPTETVLVRQFNLEDLHDELGRFQWVASNKEYDKAIDDVRRRIREMILANKAK